MKAASCAGSFVHQKKTACESRFNAESNERAAIVDKHNRTDQLQINVCSHYFPIYSTVTVNKVVGLTQRKETINHSSSAA